MTENETKAPKIPELILLQGGKDSQEQQQAETPRVPEKGFMGRIRRFFREMIKDQDDLAKKQGRF